MQVKLYFSPNTELLFQKTISDIVASTRITNVKIKIQIDILFYLIFGEVDYFVYLLLADRSSANNA